MPPDSDRTPSLRGNVEFQRLRQSYIALGTFLADKCRQNQLQRELALFLNDNFYSIAARGKATSPDTVLQVTAHRQRFADFLDSAEPALRQAWEAAVFQGFTPEPRDIDSLRFSLKMMRDGARHFLPQERSQIEALVPYRVIASSAKERR